jgi:hypothetical protein
MLTGYPNQFVHCSLAVSMTLDGNGDRRTVYYDYTDKGVLSYKEPIHKTTGLVRLVIEPSKEGADFVSRVLERIQAMNEALPRLDWWQAVPILTRKEPSKIVCSTFITEALGLNMNYLCPPRLFEEFVENENHYHQQLPLRRIEHGTI